MATAFNPGGQSPPSLSRTLDKTLDEAQYSGEINLSARKLKEYPKAASKYDIADTSVVDFSRNRLAEVPKEVCDFNSLEKLSVYHNVIRVLPEALAQLQSLVYLNISRNQLSTIPPSVCQLRTLEVLHASNNKLVSLPEEIGQLERLMDLDVSCNEITHLPCQMGDLESLHELNVRNNLLVELPSELSKLPLRHLDISNNKITHVPADFRLIEMLEKIVVENNPLQSPPAYICSKGRVHIMKYLHMEVIKEDRKRGVMSNDADLRRSTSKRSNAIPCTQPADELHRFLDSPGERRKRNTVDSGYSTTDSNEKSRWSPHEQGNTNEIGESNTLALKAGESVKEQRQERELELQRRIAQEANKALVCDKAPAKTLTPNSTPSPSKHDIVDAFTRELQRQKSEYEERKRMAGRLKLERKLEDGEPDIDPSHPRARTPSVGTPLADRPDGFEQAMQHDETQSSLRKIPHSQSFKEDRNACQNNNYRRTVSESGHNVTHIPVERLPPNSESQEYYRINGVDMSPSPQSSPGIIGSTSHHLGYPQQPTHHQGSNHGCMEDEFRMRHESIINVHRNEADAIRRRFEGGKHRMKQIQKDAVYSYFTKRAGGHGMDTDEESGFSLSQESTPNSPYSSSSQSVSAFPKSFTLPPGAQRALEQMSQDLSGLAPGFTIRRTLKHAQEEMQQIEDLRMNIESRLKVALPDDLPAALKDGVVLCHLANHIHPRSVSSIHVPSPAVPKLSVAKCRRNVENFLDACRSIGVQEDSLCPVSAILEEKGAGLLQVAKTVQALMEIAATPAQSAV